MSTALERQSQESFITFLQGLEDGVLVAHLTEQLRGLVAAMHQQQRDAGGKPQGKLAVAFTMKLDGGIFEVQTKVSTTPPTPIRMRSIFYRTPENTLTPNNPKQLELGVETRDVVSPAAQNVRVVR